MRRQRVEHKKIKLEIIITNISDNTVKLEYYSVDDTFVKEFIDKDKVFKRTEEINKERDNLCILYKGKQTYPMRDRPKNEQNKSNKKTAFEVK